MSRPGLEFGARAVLTLLRPLSLLVVLLAAWSPWLPRARAGGFYLLPRGTRGVAQGGALVAGSDGPDALWYNPAGLAYSGRQLLIDAVQPIQTIRYRRINGGGEVEPTVSSRSEPMPIPGIGYSDDFGLRRLTFGLGLMAPAVSLHTWPRSVRDGSGEVIAAPQRYTLISMAGTGFGQLSLGMALRPNPYVSIGGALTAVIGRLQLDLAMSMCDQALLCSFPESGDAQATITVPSDGFPLIARPAGGLGIIVDLADKAPLRFGLSVSSSFTLRGEAKVDLSIPQEGAFQGASLSNDRAAFAIRFPWIVRGGLEYRPLARLRLEAQATWEGWHVQDRIEVRPKRVQLSALDGAFSYELGPLDMRRGMQDVWATGVGAEHQVVRALWLRGGLMYERSSLSDPYFSILTPDTDKLVLGLGGSWAVTDAILLDASAGHIFLRDREVVCTRLFQPYPLRPGLQEPSCDEQKAVQAGAERDVQAVPIANGSYALDAWFAGLGLRVRLEPS